jgi:hypothetical protein
MIEIDIDARDGSLGGGVVSSFILGGFRCVWSVSGGLGGWTYYRLCFLGGKRRGHTTGSVFVLAYTLSHRVGVRFGACRVKPGRVRRVVSGSVFGWPAYWQVHTGVLNFDVVLYAPRRGGLRKH